MNVPSFVPVWTVILGAGIFLYVLLDGFDLGVGMLYGFMPDTRSRNIVMNAIAPIWDGNETWLVLAGLALLAAFPLAFAIIVPALYFPNLVMLLALVFRGVAFEFRFREAERRTFWDQGYSGRQHLDAADQRRGFRALVLLAEHPHPVAGAHRHRSRCGRHVAGTQ